MASGSQILSRLKFRVNTGNLKIVLLSAIAATIFWFFTALNKPYSATINYPVVFDYDKAEYIATQEVPDKIQVNVSGVGWTIFRSGYLFNAQPVFIKIDNPERDNKIVGTTIFGLVSEGLDDLELNYILEDTIYLNVEKRLSKKVFLLIDSAGIDIADNHYMVSPIIQGGDSVEVDGPRTFIDEMSDTIMVSIPRNRVDSYFDEEVPVEVGNPLATLSTETVRVSFSVLRFTEVSRDINLTKANFPDDPLVDLQDSTINLSFWVSEERADEVQESEFTVVVDYERMVTFDSTIQPLVLQYPKDIKQLSINSPRAKVIHKADSTNGLE